MAKEETMEEIFHLLNIKTAEVSKIYGAITTQLGLASWWTTETSGNFETEDIIEFRLSKDYKKCMKIVNHLS